MSSPFVLVTGADGFVGAELVGCLRSAGIQVKEVVRRCVPGENLGRTAIGDLGTFSHWHPLLEGIDTVIHLAGLAHDQAGLVTEDDYERVNVAATATLAQACRKSGVRHFVFVSTLKVLGESSGDAAFSADSPLKPCDDYSRSKARAEQALARVLRDGPTRLSIVRPPLVYGPGVKANFLRMMDAVYHGLPLPLGRVRNRRSLVSIWNLSDLLLTLVRHPDPEDAAWLVSDGEDLATPELLERLGKAVGRRARLLPMPTAVLSGVATLMGKRGEAQRLLSSLTVDMVATRERLSWQPPISVDESLRRTAEWYLAARRSER